MGDAGLPRNDLVSWCHPNPMIIRARVDVSKRWRLIFLTTYVVFLGGLSMEQLAGQVGGQSEWRRTVRGWEYAHAIQASSAPSFVPANPHEPSAISSIRQWHRIVLPIAVGSFIVTFGCWLLIGIPNRGIVVTSP